MTISGQSGVSLLDSVLASQTTRVTMGVDLLKKAEDVQKQQAAEIVQMLEQTGPQAAAAGRLDTYA